MSNRLRVLLILTIVMAAIWLGRRMTMSPCKARVSYKGLFWKKYPSPEVLFDHATETEFESAYRSMLEEDLESDSSMVIHSFSHSGGRQIEIIAHYAEGMVHYGALVHPFREQQKTFPVVLWANGLQQSRPEVNFDQRAELQQLIADLPETYILVPSYRGQSLHIGGKHYCSDGFFGDAFDGATTDALRFMRTAGKSHADMDWDSRIIYGVSRGGTVALLAGIRDTTFLGIASAAGPTDFFSRDALVKMDWQFKYQFLLNEDDVPSIRRHMIRSSPVHFIERYPGNLLLIQGDRDRIVYPFHAERIIRKLDGRPNFESHMIDGGHNINETGRVIEWINELLE